MERRDRQMSRMTVSNKSQDALVAKSTTATTAQQSFFQILKQVCPTIPLKGLLFFWFHPLHRQWSNDSALLFPSLQASL
jgi:hypothetical protein